MFETATTVGLVALPIIFVATKLPWTSITGAAAAAMSGGVPDGEPPSSVLAVTDRPNYAKASEAYDYLMDHLVAVGAPERCEFMNKELAPWLFKRPDVHPLPEITDEA